MNTQCSDTHFLYTLQKKQQLNLDKTLSFALYSLFVCQLSLGSYGLQFAVCVHVWLCATDWSPKISTLLAISPHAFISMPYNIMCLFLFRLEAVQYNLPSTPMHPPRFVTICNLCSMHFTFYFFSTCYYWDAIVLTSPWNTATWKDWYVSYLETHWLVKLA